jgi:hypothetical protein
MSLTKLAQLSLGAAALLVLVSCGGSKPPASTTSFEDEGGAAAAEEAAPVVEEDAVQEAHEDAVGVTEENHKLAREIFDAKTKLGLPTDVPEESSDSESAADKAEKK